MRSDDCGQKQEFNPESWLRKECDGKQEETTEYDQICREMTTGIVNFGCCRKCKRDFHATIVIIKVVRVIRTFSAFFDTWKLMRNEEKNPCSFSCMVRPRILKFSFEDCIP